MRRFLMLAWVPICMAMASPALGQEASRPQTPPPAAHAPFEARAAWCEAYAAWFVARLPPQPQPSDIRPTQRMENEINYCKLDPVAYQRETRAELARANLKTYPTSRVKQP
jgi:hypothetical protein